MEPVAQIDTSDISYLHSDHLYTPRLGTDELQATVWQWESDAFGNSEPQIETVEMNLRFPGQYRDSESGLFYNWNRYYDSGLGRYVTSDPIGLEGGFNTYGYVEGSPLMYFDLYGLQPIPDTPPLVAEPLPPGPPIVPDHKTLCPRAPEGYTYIGVDVEFFRPFVCIRNLYTKKLECQALYDFLLCDATCKYQSDECAAKQITLPGFCAAEQDLDHNEI